MQGSNAPVPQSYVGMGYNYLHSTGKAPVESAASAIAPQPGRLAPIEMDELVPPSEAEARGHLALVQLPVERTGPTQSAWCSVSNLVAVALSPEPGSSTAQILVLEPSNPQDCTALELPMSGPGDHVSALEWSWPGQRRALLSATASGRVVVWTQPSQQGSDDSVFPRCIDDWHGQLLLNADATTAVGGGAGHEHSQGIPNAPGPQPQAYPGGRAAAGARIKPEPSVDPVGGDKPAASPSGPRSPTQQQGGEGPHAPPPMQPALASVCWLRQPAGGRVWSTSSLAMKRLDGQGQQGPGGGAGGGGGGGQVENFDTVFCEEGAVTGAVPHWARPHQLTAAVLTSNGSLTVFWALASKLPNTLSWHRSKAVRIPPPPEADGGGGGAAAADGADMTDSTWRIASGSMCAVHDGSLALAVVYGKRRDAVYLYGMRGNPTLSGQLVPSQPAAATNATGTGGGIGPAPGGAGGRDTPAPTVSLTAVLSVPSGLSVRQCRMHVSGGGGTKRAFILAQSVAAATAPPPPPPQAYGQGGWGGPPPQPQTSVYGSAVLMCFAEGPDGGGSGSGGVAAAAAGGGGSGAWVMERRSPQLDLFGSAAAAAAGSSSSSTSAPVLELSSSWEGSKLVAACGGVVYSLDAETLTVLSAQDMAQLLPPPDEYGDEELLLAMADPSLGNVPQPSSSRTVVSATACLSSNSCCLCAVARLAPLPLPPSRRRSRRTTDYSTSYDAYDMTDDDGDHAAEDVDDGGSGAGGGDDAVVLSIRTVPDFVPPTASSLGSAAAAAALEGMEDAISCNVDTLRLAWGILHRTSLWDAAERLRSTWLSGRHDHVARCLDQLDGLLYGHDDIPMRTALATGVSRAKLEVLRRLPHPQAALLAADLLAWSRMVQYCQTLQTISNCQSEALANEETRTVAAHMVWFVMEAHLLMLAGLKLWAEGAGSGNDGGQDGVAAAGAGGVIIKRERGDPAAAAAAGDQGSDPSSPGGGASMLPLIRLFPDYPLTKIAQLSLFGTSAAAAVGKGGSDSRPVAGVGWHPAIQEALGGREVTTRLRVLISAFKYLSNHATKALGNHLQALHQGQQEGLVPGVPIVPVTAADVEATSKSGDLPRALLHRSVHSIFPGVFHLHYGRCKGVVTQQLVAQWFRQDELARIAPHITLSRETLLERYRALGLQPALMDRRHAPHLAARKLWMSFRAPAPAPELHSHVLTQHVSVRQRQRWRRQRAAALALGSAAPLWSHVQGSLLDCLTGIPLPPGTPWSLEGASAVGTVTTQMGPGVGSAGSRRNLPPMLVAAQRAWVSCAPPAELGSLWKRARLGLEQDMGY